MELFTFYTYKSDRGSCEDEARVELHQHNRPGSCSSGVQYQMGQG
jgi:hypothetical protein